MSAPLATPVPFGAGDALAMQWGTNENGNFLYIQANLVVVLGTTGAASG